MGYCCSVSGALAVPRLRRSIPSFPFDRGIEVLGVPLLAASKMGSRGSAPFGGLCAHRGPAPSGLACASLGFRSWRPQVLHSMSKSRDNRALVAVPEQRRGKHRGLAAVRTSGPQRAEDREVLLLSQVCHTQRSRLRSTTAPLRLLSTCKLMLYVYICWHLLGI